MTTLQRLICAAAVLCLMTTVVRAQDKVAYLDMEKVFEEYYKTVNANVAFELRKQEYEDRVEILREELSSKIAEVRKLEAEVQNDLLGEEAKEDARRKLQQRFDRYTAIRDEHDRFRQSGMQELQKIRANTEDELVNELITVIKKFAADNAYTHVIEVTGKTFNRIPVFLVYPENEEITDNILKIINVGHEEEQEMAKKRLDDLRNKTKPAEVENVTAPAAAEDNAPVEVAPAPAPAPAP